MTTASQNKTASQNMETFYREEAERKAADRMTAVLTSPHAKGREALATKLLSVSGDHSMSAEQIIKTLEKAPAPNVSGTGTPLPAVERVDPIDPRPNALIFDTRLMRAGEEAAKFLLNKE